MKPKPTSPASQGDLFKVELISIISSQHPLVKLADLIPWDDFERQLQPTYAPTTGALGISTRLMTALHMLLYSSSASSGNRLQANYRNGASISTKIYPPGV